MARPLVAARPRRPDGTAGPPDQRTAASTAQPALKGGTSAICLPAPGVRHHNRDSQIFFLIGNQIGGRATEHAGRGEFRPMRRRTVSIVSSLNVVILTVLVANGYSAPPTAYRGAKILTAAGKTFEPGTL